MKQPPIFSRVSIRTVLFSVLLVFGGSSLVASLQRTGDSLRDYRENRIVAERSRIDAQLLTAGQHLAYERSRTAVVLSDAGQVSDKDRAFIDERRQLADGTLDSALDNVGILPQELVSRLIEQRQEIRKLRSEVDREAGLSFALRDKQLTARWFDSAGGFIDFIHRSVERLIGLNRPGDKTTRLSLLADAVLQQRMMADSEASVIAQALAAGHQPAALNLLYEMRGREDQLWLDIERLAAATGDDAVLRRVEEIKTQHLVLFRPLQDKALAGLFARGAIPVSLDKLTSASLPVLDGLSGLMILALEHAVNIATQGEAEARGSLIADIVWSVFFLLLLMFALRYVLRYVIAPLEQVDRELRRLGELPEGNEKGNEIERIKVSAMTLERSIASHAEADQRMRLFLERQLVGMAITSPEKGWLKVNDKTCQMLGYSFEELQQLTWAELAYPDDLAADVAQFECLLSGEIDGYMLEKRFVRKNGSIVYTNLAIGCVRRSDGSVDYVLTMLEDITVRKEMENSLHNSQRMYAEAQRIAHLGSWELNLAEDALSWTDEIYRIFEAEPHQFGASYEAFMNAVHPDDREMVDSAYKASLENREPYEIEHRLLFPDGRIKFVLERCETYYAEDGKPLRSLGTVQDITERKLMEKTLIDSEREFRSLAENLPDNIIRWDVEGRYIYINPTHEHTLGVLAKDMIGKRIPDTHDRVKAGIAQVVSTEQPMLFIRQTVLVNGETQIHDVKIVPERDAAGKLVAVLGIGRDMTEFYRLQDESKAREQQLRALADSSPGMMGSFYARPDGSVCMPYVSPNIEKLFGLRPQDVAVDAAPLLALNHPDDAQRVKESIAESARTMTIWHEEYRILHPTLGERWMESNTKPELHPDGGIVWYGYVHDITDSKQAKHQLELLERAVNWSSDAIFIIDEQLHFVYVNDAACRSLGYSREELLRMGPPDIDPDITREAATEMMKTMQAGSAVIFESHHRARDGRVFPVELSFSLCESDGKKLSLTVVRDISERKKTEELLRYHEQEFRSLIENSQDTIVRYDSECRRIYANPAFLRLIGKPLEAMLGKLPTDYSSASQAVAYENALRRALESGEEVEHEYTWTATGGRMIVSHFRIVPEWGADGRVASVLAIGRDLTERKRMEEELIAREQEFRTLAENLPDPVFRYGRDGRRLYVNPAAVRVTSTSEGQLIGNPEDCAAVQLDSAARTKAAILDVFVTGECCKLFVEYINGDGSTSEYQGILVPEFDANGQVATVLAIAHDVTVIRGLERRQSQYFEMAPGVFATILKRADGSYAIPFISDGVRDVYGVEPEAVMRDIMVFVAVAHPDDAEMTFRKADESARDLTYYQVEYRINHPSKGVRWIECNSMPQRLPDGGVRWAGFYHDITERKRMEAEVTDARDFLNKIIDGIADPIFVKDRQHRWTLLNDAFCTFIGHPREMLLGKSDYDFFPEEQADEFWAKDEIVFNAGESNLNEESFTTATGEEHYIQTRKTPFVSGDGQPMLVGVIRDLTERKQMEENLRLKEEKLGNLFALSPLGIALTDMQGRYVEFNEAFRKICGYPADELMRLEYWELTPKEYEAREAEQLESLSNTGRYGPYEKEYRQKNGNLIPIQLNGVLVKGGDGKDYIWSIVEDITERRRLSDELSRSKERYLQIFDNAQEGMYLIDVTEDHRFRIAEANPAFAQQIGIPRDEMIERFIEDILAPDAPQKVLTVFNRALNAGGIYRDEQEYDMPIVGLRTYHTTLAPVRDGADSIRRIVGIVSDITDLNRYQEAREAALAEAMRLAKTRSEFLAHMSHELRTPLNAILGYTQILQRDESLGERNSDALNVIRQSGEHLLTLVEDILDLARIEVGRFKLDLSDISVVPFLRVVTDIVRIRAKQKGLEFTTDLAADLPLGILGDDKRLRQVLLNLLSNAVKFTDHGRVVLHVSRANPSHLAFAIQDTGIGIAANEMETIFQPFEQSSDAQQRLGGTGLGLAISRELVRLMGGDIAVESRIGEGSVFSFELELPDVEIEPVAWLAASVEQGGDDSDDQLILPPVEEMQVLHKLAQLGNMRDIVRYAERIAGLAPRFQPFAERLRRMAENYQSKAILAFVEGNLHDAKY